ncbi:MAG TPA: dTMP kinase [Thermoanaerobaculia bacterium]|nr:dTMP kinase [Thermoanaerobaculia bacterium]
MPLVTFEGIEGSGKSTQARRAAELLRSGGREVLLEREPGGTAIGARLREVLLDPASRGLDPLSELLLMEADRRQHVAEVLEPALARGALVLCDRFNDATFAYQGGGRGLAAEIVAAVDGWAVGEVRPKRTLLFDCPVELGLARARRRDGEATARFEEEDAAFHERVRRAYLGIARRDPARVKVIDSSRSPDLVFADVARHLEGL